MVWTIFGQHATMLLDIGRTLDKLFLKVAPLQFTYSKKPTSNRVKEYQLTVNMDARPLDIISLKVANMLRLKNTVKNLQNINVSLNTFPVTQSLSCKPCKPSAHVSLSH